MEKEYQVEVQDEEEPVQAAEEEEERGKDEVMTIEILEQSKGKHITVMEKVAEEPQLVEAEEDYILGSEVIESEAIPEEDIKEVKKLLLNRDLFG